MTDREKLIQDLLPITDNYLNTSEDKHFTPNTTIADVADLLIEKGWIRPPCKVGQDMWYVCEHYDGSVEIKKGKVSMLQQKADKSWKVRITINSSVWDFTPNDMGTRYFLTKEEAEEKLRGLRK